MEAYTVILSLDPDSGGYSVTVPAMPGAITEADTRDATLAAVADVMATWLEMAAADGYRPLDETPDIIGRQVASVIEDRQAEGWDDAIETASVRPAVESGADHVQATGDRPEYNKSDNQLNLIIPDRPSISPGTLRQIIKTMGLTVDEFLKLAMK